MPISQYSGSKYGESSANNGGGASSSSTTYYSSSRSRETPSSERGRERVERDKEWSGSSGSRGGREWRRAERDRSRDRDRDKDRQRSPSRNSSRFATDYNSTSGRGDRERRPDRYYSASSSTTAAPSTPTQEEPGVRRVSRFATGGTGKYADGSRTTTPTASYSTVPTGATSSLIREKDLLQNPGLTNSILHGNQYGSYHFGSQAHFSDFPSYQSLGRKTTTGQEKDPKNDPLFKAALDAIITNIKTKGDYDQVRKECFSDIDTKAAFINLHGRIKVTADKYLGLQSYKKDMDKVKTREGMRKKILDTPYFEKGIESLVNQILTPKINALIRPKIEEEVFKYLKIDNNGENAEDLNKSANSEPVENHKHESIETREIMPDSPPHKDSDKMKRRFSKQNDIAETSEGSSTPRSPQEPYQIGDNSTRDSDMSVSSSEKSLEIDLDARSENMDESSEHTRPDEEPTTPVNYDNSPTVLSTDAHAPPPPPPPPPPPISSPVSSILTSNIVHSCSLSTMNMSSPYASAVRFGGHLNHFALGGLPTAPGIIDHSLSLQSMTHAPPPSLPPLPMPPLPPSTSEHPPPPPSPPKPPPPPMCDDDACSSPPGGSRMLPCNDEEDEPLPPGEEPDSYFSEMRLNKFSQSVKPEEKPEPEMPPPPPPAPIVEVDLDSIKLPGEESEPEVEDDEEEIEEDSEEESPMFEKICEVSPPRVVLDSEEEESPMFEKICEVSPPRPVELLNSAAELVHELKKDLLIEEVDGNIDEEDNGQNEDNKKEVDSTISKLQERRCSDSECKFLETIPDFEYKQKFFKRILDT